MKIIKKITTLLLATTFILSSMSCLYNFIKIQNFNYEYHKYKTEEANIVVRIDKRDNFTDCQYVEYLYDSVEDYQKIYADEIDVYKTILSKQYVNNFDISTWLIYVDDISQIHLIGKIKEKEFDNLEGRSFTKEEIENGSKVAVINYGFAKKRNLEVGDKFTFNYPHDGLSGIEVEIIGIYGEITENDNYTGIIFMPEKTLKDISDTWLNEMSEIHKENVFAHFIPASIFKTDIICKSEQNYEQVTKLLRECQKQNDFIFNYSRESWEHYKQIDETESKAYERNLTSTLPLMLISLILFIIWFVYRKNNFDELEEKIEKNLMKEKEKNIQNVFQMNQETHQLKHDMKHFLIQLSTLIENDEKEKGLQLIHEYYEDIEALDLPVYTQNNTIDVLINHYSKKAKKLNVDFTYSGNLIYELKVNERKLFILLSNALDNAFTHGDSQSVNMSITYVEPYHRFVIMNTFTDNKLESNKEHGYGLESMKKIVEEMNGELLLEIKDNTYICTILIPN